MKRPGTSCRTYSCGHADRPTRTEPDRLGSNVLRRTLLKQAKGFQAAGAKSFRFVGRRRSADDDRETPCRSFDPTRARSEKGMLKTWRLYHTWTSCRRGWKSPRSLEFLETVGKSPRSRSQLHGRLRMREKASGIGKHRERAGELPLGLRVDQIVAEELEGQDSQRRKSTAALAVATECAPIGDVQSVDAPTFGRLGCRTRNVDLRDGQYDGSPSVRNHRWRAPR